MSAQGHGIRITWTWTWPPVRPKGQKNDKKHAKCLAPSKNLTRGGSPLELSRCLACQAQLTTMEALVEGLGVFLARAATENQHLRTSTSAIEGLALMTRAASVTSTWRSSQRSVLAARFHSCAAETRCLSDVAARQNGAARLEKRSVEAQQRPLSRLLRAGFGGARRVRRAKTQGAMELPSRRSAQQAHAIIFGERG